MPCRKPFAGATARARAPSLASQTFCCAFTQTSSLGPSLSAGTAWRRRRKRHEMFPAYQSGRQFDDELVEQLSVLPEFVAACGFANAKAPGFEADDFLAAAVAAEERAGGSALVASGDRDSFQLASPSTTILYPSGAGRNRARRARRGPAAIWRRSEASTRLHRASWRSIRQTAWRGGSWAKARRRIGAAIRVA